MSTFKKITWDEKTNSVIQKLHPIIRPKATFFVNYLEEENIYIRIYSGFRTADEQLELYSKGRDLNGNIIDKNKVVTNAKPFQSYHNYGLAFDCVHIDNGKALWGSPKEKEIVLIAEFFGFEWGGKWGDNPHFQYTLGLHYTKLFKIHSEKKYKDGYINLDQYL